MLTAAVKSTDAEVRNFVAAVVDNGRLAAMPEIAEQFEALKNAAAGSADATIESAFPLEGELAHRRRACGGWRRGAGHFGARPPGGYADVADGLRPARSACDGKN